LSAARDSVGAEASDLFAAVLAGVLVEVLVGTLRRTTRANDVAFGFARFGIDTLARELSLQFTHAELQSIRSTTASILYLIMLLAALIYLPGQTCMKGIQP
jgi:hypothetical protein